MSAIKLLSNAGVKSDYLFYAGLASIGLSLGSWLLSRSKPDDDKAQADRWGIFVGHWVPSFFALGIALQAEEHHQLFHSKALHTKVAKAAVKSSQYKHLKHALKH